MKKITIIGLMILFTMSLLVSGCAKKAEEDIEINEKITQEEQVQEDNTDTAIDEQDVQEEDAAAIAKAAALAATNGLVRIQFDFDQYVLTGAAKQILFTNADLLNAAPAINVSVEGHCDERGSDEYNLALGEKRALATKSYLVSLGVTADRLTVISYGEETPIDPSSTKDAWAQNRRAEFKVKR